MEDARLPKPIGLRARVREIIDEARDVKSFRFADDAGASPAHLPGQFLWITVPVPSGDRSTTRRSFTIASSPTEREFFQITVKRHPGSTVSRFLHEQVKPGDVFDVRAPYGFFTFTEGTASRILLIGGGSGITPLRAILRFICDTGAAVRASLLYLNSTEEDIVFRRELEGMPSRHPGVRVSLSLTRPGPGWEGLIGRISEAHIDTVLRDGDPDRIYLCGPPGMMRDAEEWILKRGIGPECVITESFGVAA